MAEEKTTNEEEFDICVSCGKVTSYKTGSYDVDPEWTRYG